jgi:hypothetical protein
VGCNIDSPIFALDFSACGFQLWELLLFGRGRLVFREILGRGPLVQVVSAMRWVMMVGKEMAIVFFMLPRTEPVVEDILCISEISSRLSQK